MHVYEYKGPPTVLMHEVPPHETQGRNAVTAPSWPVAEAVLLSSSWPVAEAILLSPSWPMAEAALGDLPHPVHYLLEQITAQLGSVDLPNDVWLGTLQLPEAYHWPWMP